MNKGGSLENKGGGLENKGGGLENKGGSLENKGGSLENKGGSLENKSGSLENKGDSLENKGDSLENKLPEEILTLVTNLGRRSSKRQLLFAVLKLCSVEAMTIERIALLTKRSEQHIRQNNIRILLREGLLEPIYESPTNPSQALRTTEKGRVLIANHELGGGPSGSVSELLSLPG